MPSWFRYDPKRLADLLTTENEESCTTYNMLKVLLLFNWYLLSSPSTFSDKLCCCGMQGQRFYSDQEP
jgi:hypothetical protein